MPPRIIFGAGGIGEGSISHTWTTPSTVAKLLSSLEDLGLTQLDSAASYPPGAPWVTETLLGEADAAKKGFIIDTKIEVTNGPEGRGAGHLSENHIDESVAKTLKLLGTKKACVSAELFAWEISDNDPGQYSLQPWARSGDTL